jgi:hypothetical protein
MDFLCKIATPAMVRPSKYRRKKDVEDIERGQSSLAPTGKMYQKKEKKKKYTQSRTK